MSQPRPPFSGERMRCALCTRSQWSHPQIESGWYRIDIDGQPHYCCPPCANNKATPQCGRCRKFYHEDYLACPFCAEKKGERA